jgi:hypothetical protein
MLKKFIGCNVKMLLFMKTRSNGEWLEIIITVTISRISHNNMKMRSKKFMNAMSTINNVKSITKLMNLKKYLNIIILRWKN